MPFNVGRSSKQIGVREVQEGDTIQHPLMSTSFTVTKVERVDEEVVIHGGPGNRLQLTQQELVWKHELS